MYCNFIVFAFHFIAWIVQNHEIFGQTESFFSAIRFNEIVNRLWPKTVCKRSIELYILMFDVSHTFSHVISHPVSNFFAVFC